MSGEVILEAKNICKSFSGVQVLKNVNFSVRKGEVHALMGENGAGKSILIKILTGAYTKDCGTILWKGKPGRSTAWGTVRRWACPASTRNFR